MIRFLFIILLFFFIGCSKKTNPADVPNKDFKQSTLNGIWNIEPSNGDQIIFEASKKIYLYKNDERIPLDISIDSQGIILNNKNSNNDINVSGYFLFDEKTENEWTGILDGDVVKLVRDIAPEENSESILE